MFNTPDGNKFLKLGSIVLIVFAVFLAVFTLYGLRLMANVGDKPATNTISVNGKAELMIVPDIATFNFGTQETSETVESAQKLATDKINKAIDLVKKAGVEEKDIKTISYNINPHYEQGACTQFRCPPAVITGYDVSQQVEVKVRDTAKAGGILSSLGSVNLNNISGLTFTVDDDESKMDEARKMAIKDAREKAEELADSLDARLGRLVTYYDNNPYPMPYYAKGGVAMDVAMVENQAMGAPSLPAGENQIVSNVTLVYELK